MSAGNKLEKVKVARSKIKSTKAYNILKLIFDDESFSEIDSLVKSGEGYVEVLAGFGLVNGCPAYVFAQNVDIDGGAVSKAQLAKIKKIYDLAAKTGVPIVGIYNSIGARLQEGLEMLSSYGELLAKANNVSGVVPQISLILGACIGTNAMIASCADIIVMSKNGELGINTAGEDSSFEYAGENGLAHIIEKDDNEAIKKVRMLIPMLPSNNLSSPLVGSVAGVAYNESEPNEAIKVLLEDESKDITQDVIDSCFDTDSFIKLKKDYGQAFCTGLAKVEGESVGVIISNREYNSGTIDKDSCEKATQFISFCDAFSIPIISFIDSKGFNSLKQATKLSNAYAEASTVKVTVIIGNAYGALYIATAGKGANADMIFAWPMAIISALEPQTAVAMMWQDRLKGSTDPILDREKLVEEYKKTEASALNAAHEGFVNDVIEPKETRSKIISAINMLSGKRVSGLPKKHSVI